MNLDRYCVLHLASAVPDDALLDREVVRGRARPARQELIAAALMAFDVEDGGIVRDLRLDGFFSGLGELTILRALGVALGDQHARGATLAGYDDGDDLAWLRRRAGRHWLFGTFDLDGWDRCGAFRLDLADAERDPPPLGEAARAAGFAGLDLEPSGVAGLPDADAACQMGVAAKYLLLLHELAHARSDAIVLLSGWRTFTRHLLTDRGRFARLRRIRTRGRVGREVLVRLRMARTRKGVGPCPY